MRSIDYIDTHTGGEPTRVVLSGLPDLGAGSLAEQRLAFAAQHDRWRSAIACEPRGSDAMVGALLLPPQYVYSVASVIFFNNVGTLGMCGHGTIGLVRTLAHLGRIGPGRHAIDTPVGTVVAQLHEDGLVSIDNVESYRHARDVELDVPGYGRVRGDVAWGGNWFYISRDCPIPLEVAQWRELTRYTEAIRHALEAASVRGADGAQIDHIELNGAARTPDADARNFVLCPGLAYDRSPCGTGFSAKLACLAADGALAPGAVTRMESVLGSVFEGSYQPADGGRIHPRISGRAHLMAQGRLLIEDDDPFAWGVRPD
ncbi:proline racemase family protein [Lysobacter sp. 5GHs7-4]|uniref:proline racemase family protein n=1 Tax=Lysobacter sp. 5GHs7-4 TaxID=2904253 RepID=UPI001E2E7798|nr:proline racemase family protein [Lysobacter sp. 5GHs7-4]UHQ23355.1 proline racemase family protein [Lysobacter sp. 5GHs7-4]